MSEVELPLSFISVIKTSNLDVTFWFQSVFELNRRPDGIIKGQTEPPEANVFLRVTTC